MATYSDIRKRREELARKIGNSDNTASVQTEEETNKGGFFGGLGYTLEKLV